MTIEAFREESKIAAKEFADVTIRLLDDDFAKCPEWAVDQAEAIYYRLGFWLQDHDMRSKL